MLTARRTGSRSTPFAQNFTENPTSYPPEVTGTERFTARLASDVPAGRLGRPDETAQPALFLASSASDFFSGRVVPLDSGWSA